MTNSFTKSREERKKQNTKGTFDVGEILNVAPNSRHIVVFTVLGENTPDTASVLVPARNDINLPEEGDLVIIGYTRSGVPFVFGTIYTEQDATLDYEPSDRRISHTLTSSKFEISRDGSAIIEGFSGSQAILRPDGSVQLSTDDGATAHLKEDGSIVVENSAGSSVRLEGDTVIIDAQNVELAGTGGNAVARVGDSVDTTSGVITGGSDRVNAN